MWTTFCGDSHPCLTLHPLPNIDIYPDNIRPLGLSASVDIYMTVSWNQNTIRFINEGIHRSLTDSLDKDQ